MTTAGASKDVALFALRDSDAFAAKVAAELGTDLAAHEERDFEDGEHKIRPLESVRGRDVFAIGALYGEDEPGRSPNDKLCRLLFFIGALKDAGAARVTAVVPYLCYARKDRRTKTRDPVTSRYVIALFEAAGADALIAFEVHNVAALQNAARGLMSVHIEARHLFAPRLAARVAGDDVAVVSPDPGGAKRADRTRDDLERALERELAVAFLHKRRSGGVMSGSAAVGDVQGKTAIVIDDLISTGGTLVRAARALKAAGAQRVLAAAAHGLLTGDADTALADPALDAVLVSDTVPPFRLGRGGAADKLEVVSVAPIFADAIDRLHRGRTLSPLTEG